MTRFRALHELLTGEPVLTDAQRRAVAAAERAAAAELRGDDRALGLARMQLQQAQHDRLERGE